MHALAGNLGWASAPVLLTGIAAAAGWRVAAFVSTAVALVVLATVVLLRDVMADAARPHGEGDVEVSPVGTPFAFLGVGAVWMCFLFFFASTMGFGALQNFGPSVLKNVYGMSLAASASALTAYLLGGAGGIAAGGFLAARYQAHERIVAVLLTAAALMSLALATGGLPGGTVLPFMALVGFCTGSATPSRDLLVRRAAMARFGARSFGRIYGFVYSGLDVGLSGAPALFGRLMDRGMFRAVLCGVAIFQALAVLAALGIGPGRTVSEAPGSPGEVRGAGTGEGKPPP